MKEDVVDEEEDLHRIKYKARARDIFKIPNYLNEVLYRKGSTHKASNTVWNASYSLTNSVIVSRRFV